MRTKSRLLLLVGVVSLMALLQSSPVSAASSSSSKDNDDDCPCGALMERPDIWQKELTARWMVHTLEYGVLSTISSRLMPDANNNNVMPFGNVYSFVDGSCANSTGTPYFYGTYMDQTFQDMKENAQASFTLSEASLASVCGANNDNNANKNNKNSLVRQACSITAHPHMGHKHVGDPESPICARLVLSGQLVQISESSNEYAQAQEAFFHRHPQMAHWPDDHEWVIAKLVLQDIWLIDYFGGASILDVAKYYSQDLVVDQKKGH